MAEDGPNPNGVIVVNGKPIVIRVAELASLFLWMAENQDDLRHKGAWTIDHVPGSVCVKRTIIETIK